MIRPALITALLASLFSTPVIAHETIRNAGTADAAIRTQEGYVQVEYLDFHYQHRNDPGYRLYEDGSPALVDPTECFITSPDGSRYAIRDC